jgi:hypothetical protein
MESISSAPSQLRVYAMTATVRVPVFKRKMARWIDCRLSIFTFIHHRLNEYSTPKNLNYWWNCGSLVVIVARAASAYYLAHFQVLLLLVGVLEAPSPIPAGIAGARRGRTPDSVGIQ